MADVNDKNEVIKQLENALLKDNIDEKVKKAIEKKLSIIKGDKSICK